MVAKRCKRALANSTNRGWFCMNRVSKMWMSRGGDVESDSVARSLCLDCVTCSRNFGWKAVAACCFFGAFFVFCPSLTFRFSTMEVLK